MQLLALLPCLLAVNAAPQQSDTSTEPVPTATPSPSAPSSPLPSQAPLPPKQDWCPSAIFCPGALLQSVNLARVFPDSKTFVDKPTDKSSEQVLTDYRNLGVENGTATQGSIAQYVAADFVSASFKHRAYIC
jgi:alpha,alpha-trehalase